MLLNGDDCVPELLSLPEGDTYQVAAVSEAVSGANNAPSAAARREADRAGIIFRGGWRYVGVGAGKQATPRRSGEQKQKGRQGTGRTKAEQASNVTGE